MTTFMINNARLLVESNALFCANSELLDSVIKDITSWLQRWYARGVQGNYYFSVEQARTYVQAAFEQTFSTKVVVAYTQDDNRNLVFCVMSRALVEVEIDLQKGESCEN